jgi:hypothetical protein
MSNGDWIDKSGNITTDIGEEKEKLRKEFLDNVGLKPEDVPKIVKSVKKEKQ